MANPATWQQTERPALKRDYALGLKSAALWLSSPLNGIDNAFEFIFALAGPTVQREFDKFAAHPVGKRLMEERPDLIAVLSDRDQLATLPEGSFGRAYLDFVSQENMEGMEGFADLANLPEISKRLGWSDDITWFVQRMLPSHDLFHVLSGYGREASSEAAVIVFTFGQWPLKPLWLMVGAFSLLRPRVGWRRWHRYLREAYRRGRDTTPLSCADYERLLPRPMEAVREELGISQIADAHPEGMIIDWFWLPKNAKAMAG